MDLNYKYKSFDILSYFQNCQSLLPLLTGVALCVVSGAPLGARQSTESTHETLTHVVSLGAPTSFQLFFPKIPSSSDSVGEPHETRSPTPTAAIPAPYTTKETNLQQQIVKVSETSDVPVVRISQHESDLKSKSLESLV